MEVPATSKAMLDDFECRQLDGHVAGCRYNRFYTLTAQCPEADVPTYRSTLEGVINSFRPPAPAV